MLMCSFDCPVWGPGSTAPVGQSCSSVSQKSKAFLVRKLGTHRWRLVFLKAVLPSFLLPWVATIRSAQTMLCLGCMSRLQVVGHVCVRQENTIADQCTGRWGKPSSGLYLSSSPKRVGQLRDEQPVVLRVFAQTKSWSMCW